MPANLLRPGFDAIWRGRIDIGPSRLGKSMLFFSRAVTDALKAAVAIRDRTLLASLVRRDGESFPDLLKRLDTAIGKAVHEGTVANEINGGRFHLAASSIRKKR